MPSACLKAGRNPQRPVPGTATLNAGKPVVGKFSSVREREHRKCTKGQIPCGGRISVSRFVGNSTSSFCGTDITETVSTGANIYLRSMVWKIQPRVFQP